MVVNSLYYGSPDLFVAQTDTGIAISDDIIAEALINIYRHDFDTEADIEPTLFRAIAGSLGRAVEEGAEPLLGKDPLLDALRHSTDVFAAFKVHRAQNDMAARLFDSNGNLKPFEQWREEVLPIATHQCHNWLETEYNTAVLRARQAANWQQFLREKDILPNLKWLPSTSPNPGADHRPYWNTVLPIEHPFWDEHRPGDRWNCKCALTSTDEPPTPVPSSEPSLAPHSNLNAPQQGLKGNPGKTQSVFSADHPYFPKDCKHCAFYSPTVKARLQTVFKAQAKDCFNCPYIDGCMDKSITKKKESERKAIYNNLKNDSSFKDVKYDKLSGGVKAIHIGHIEHSVLKEELFFDGLTSSDLERECANQLYKDGHTVLLLDESKAKGKNRLTALDMNLDGRTMDIRSVTGNGWYSNIFREKDKQIAKYNAREDVTVPADALCLYFYDSSLFDESKMKKSINFYKYLRHSDGSPKIPHIKTILCVIRGEKGIRIYEI